jgi:hypothetical protein
MTMAAGPGRYARREPETVTGQGTVVAVRRSQVARRGRRAAWLRIGLGILRSRPFHEQVILVVIAVAALARIARENQDRTFARLAAWDRRQHVRDQRKTRAG